MSKISFAEWYADVKNRQAVAEGISNRHAIRERYDDKDWISAKTVLSGMNFPDPKFKDHTKGAKKIAAGESHETGKEFHGLVTFELIEDIDDFPLIWRFSYCPQCKKTINKFAVLTNDYTNKAYRKWYVRNGNLISKDDILDERVEPKIKENQEFVKVLDGLSSIGGDFDGK